MKTIKLMIVENTRIILDGMDAIFRHTPGIKIVALAESGEEAIYRIEKGLEVDVILMDIIMGEGELDGIETTRQILKIQPQIKVVGQTAFDTRDHVRNMVRAGAVGMIFKEAGYEEFTKAVRAVYEGETYFGKKIPQILLENYLPNKDNINHPKSHFPITVDQLTRREIDVLKLILAERKNSEIADILNISGRTVESHRRNLMQKTGARTMVGLTQFAIKHQVIFDPDEFPGIDLAG